MSKKETMTPSLEDYLKTIYLLHKTDNSVRLIDIAERLSVTKPSVSRAVSQLNRMGLVEHELYAPVLITDQGIDLAEKLVDKHGLIKRFLIRSLHIDEALADSEACAIEHGISSITLEKMALNEQV